jgi:hypothetical protein
MRTLIPVAVMALTLTACAQMPNDIEGSYVPPTQYADADCDQLGTVVTETKALLQPLLREQGQRVAADAAGLILIGLSPTMFAPDNSRETQIATLRGHIAAARREGGRKTCTNLPPVEKFETAMEISDADKADMQKLRTNR